MKLNYLLIKNFEEIEKADRLGLDVPKKKYIKREMFININDITYACITSEGYIEMKVDNDYFLIEYDDYYWNLIGETINAREKRK